MKRILLPLIALLLAGTACTVPDKADSKGVVSDSGNATNRPQDDVTISSCSNGEYLPKVSVAITNHTSKRSNYTVSVNLLTASGTKVGDGIVLAQNIDPGQSSIEDLLATTHSAFSSCKVMEVQRYAA